LSHLALRLDLGSLRFWWLVLVIFRQPTII